MSVPTKPMNGAATRGASAVATASASGANSMSDKWIVTSARRQHEVEDEGGDAEQQQRRVGPQEAGLDRAHRGGARPHHPGRSADEQAVDDQALERVAGEAAEPRERAD